MSCFKGDVKKDELCGIVIQALQSGPKSSKELFLICKERYAEFWKKRKYSLGVIVSNSEIYYRIRRLVKDGLIEKREGEYRLARKLGV